MPEKAWKRGERKTAARVGARRQPGSGSQGDPERSTSDTTHAELYIEEKYRARHAVRSLYTEVATKAMREGKVPIVTLRSKALPGVLYVIHERYLDLFAAHLQSTAAPETPQ